LNHPVIIIYFCHQSSTGVLDKTLDRVLEQYISPIRTKLVLEAFDVCVMTECLFVKPKVAFGSEVVVNVGNYFHGS